MTFKLLDDTEQLLNDIESMQAILEDMKKRYSKKVVQVSKLKLFIEIFNVLSVIEVKEENFRNELLLTGKFTGDEIDMYIKKAKENGQIFERKEGWLAKA